MTGAREAIEDGSRTFARLYNSGDAAGMAALYTEDAALFPPGAQRIDGRSAVETFWHGAMTSGLADLALATIEVEEAGSVAVEIGTVTASIQGEDGDRMPITGKFVVVWHRDNDGRWRLHRDIWNFDT